MSHGYARVINGRVLLGFADPCPLFEQLAPNEPTIKLVPAQDGDEVVGFSVANDSDPQHGFLWYSEAEAEDSAANLRVTLNKTYQVIPLKLS